MTFGFLALGSSSVPTNGIYLPATNNIGLAANSAKVFDCLASSGTCTVAGSLQTGAAGLTLTTGAFGMPKMTASASAPGAAGAKFEVVCGTNAGTAKLTMSAGTSSTVVTVVDNVGSGVTGC